MIRKVSQNDPYEKNPLDVARKLGYSIAGNLGAEAFVELELAYVSGLLPRFSDNPLIRVRQNILLHWDQSYFKSTLINEFAKTIPATLGVIDITSMSPQMIFGSISENRKFIIKPAFAGKRFALITELLSFIGTGNTMREIVNIMNKVMESEVVTRRLLKLSQMTFDPSQIEKLKQQEIYYDPSQAQLCYQPYVCILAASRPMDNRTYTYLRRSGHLYRYHVIQHEISDEEAKRYFTEDFHPDLKLQEELEILNMRLMKILVKNLSTPPKSSMSKIFAPLEEIVKDEAEKQRLAEIIDVRTKGDVIREITDHAFLRTAVENGFRGIKGLEYTEEDVEFILQRLSHFVEFKINPLYVEEWTAPRIIKKRLKDQAKEFILDLLADKDLRSGTDIVESTFAEVRCSKATAHSARRELEYENKICSPKYGLYKLKEDCKTSKVKNSCTSSIKDSGGKVDGE